MNTVTAAPERARWPLTAAPQPRLRPLLPRGYAGFTEATSPRHLMLPASASVSLVVKLADSAHRPPAFVMGPQRSPWVVEGDCAPSYLEVRLTPLGAYRLLGLPSEELSGQPLDLTEAVGADGRRLAERLRETPGWRRRFALLDRFLHGRLDRGPRPSPEVAWVWRRLEASGGGVAIGRLAAEVGWPPAPDRQIPAAGRALPQDRGPAGPLRRGVAAPGPGGWAAGLGAAGSRGRLRRPGASGARIPPVHRDHPDRVPGPDPSVMSAPREDLMTTETQVLDLVNRWAEAEQGNDAEALEGLLAHDFVGVGPLGFVLDRQQWLARFGNGLENRAFAVEDAQARDYGTAAVVVGVLAQETSFQGRDNSGRFRLTLVATRPNGRWLLANAHIGTLQQPGGPPPS